MPRAALALTKRRAVDFCHVATALCPRPEAVIPDPAAAPIILFRRRPEAGDAAVADH